MTGKWSGAFWRDLAERTGFTAVAALIVWLPTANTTSLTFEAAWAGIGLTTALTFLKCLLANLKDPASGASFLSPPGPVLEDASGQDVASKSFESSHRPQDPNQHGAVNWLFVIGVAVVVIALILLFSVIDVNKDKDNDGKHGLDWERTTSAMVLR